jgi:tetratricopeptide (TPR) repeat protein
MIWVRFVLLQAHNALLTAPHFHAARIATCLEPSDMDVVYSMLLTKGITALHSRCIIFVNNLFVSSIFADRIMERLVPAVMALLMYNVTNHVKLKKHREAQMLLGDVQEAQASTPHRQKKQKASEMAEASDPAAAVESLAEQPHPPATQLQSPPIPTSSENVDPLYDERLYTDFVSSACLFLGNATGSPEVCRMVEAYSIIDIMTLLFHGADHSLDALVSVVKCLANLANIRDNRPKLLDSNVLPLAVKLLQLNVQYEDLRAHLTLLVGNMAGDATAASPTLAALLSDPTLIAAICDLFVSTHIDSHERFALLALANLSLDAAVVPVLAENVYCVRKIINCCLRTTSNASTYWILRQSVRLLHAIAAAPQSQQLPSLLKALGAEEALKKLLSTCQADSRPSENGAPPTPSPHAKTLSNIEQLASAALAYVQAAPDIQLSLPSEEPFVVEEPAKLLKPTPAVQAKPTTKPAPSAQAAADLKHAAPVINTPVSKPVMRDAPLKQPNPQRAADEKERGNEFFHKKRFKEAIICYTRAADWSPADYTLFSNRAAAYMHLEHYELALKDAERCIEMAPTWVKGWFRKGKSLVGLEQYDAAIAALNHALKMEEGNKEIQDALRIASTRMKAKQSGVSTILHQNPLIHHNALAALTRVPMK